MSLNRDQITEFDDRPSALVDVWGGQVMVKAMSTKDRIDFEAAQKDNKSQTEMVVLYVLYSCTDDNGNKLFKLEDKELIESKSPASLLKIFNASISLNTLNSETIEEQAKNS